MGELKDRDRELSDMMNSHQQQLVAWQQDRDRLATLERKCTQYEGTESKVLIVCLYMCISYVYNVLV